MSKIKVVICDDLKHIRDYFRDLLSGRDDIEVVGTASSGAEAVEVVDKVHPDIVLMDIQMEEEYAGIDATKIILSRHSDVKVIIITIHEEDDYIMEAYAAGAVDFIIKTNAEEEICDSIVKVYNGTEFIRPYVAKKILSEFARLRHQKKSFLYVIDVLSKLTKNELSILKALYNGNTQRQIAAQRSVELGTIKFHVGNILRKLNYSSTKDIMRDLKELEIFEHFYKD